MVAAPQAGRRFGALMAALLGAVWTAPAHSTEVPLWELGAGLGAIVFEDYRGSGTVHGYPLPVPYFVYNGTFLKADHNGVRGTLFDQDWVELNLSGNLTTPVRSDRALTRTRGRSPGRRRHVRVYKGVRLRRHEDVWRD